MQRRLGRAVAARKRESRLEHLAGSSDPFSPSSRNLCGPGSSRSLEPRGGERIRDSAQDLLGALLVDVQNVHEVALGKFVHVAQGHETNTLFGRQPSRESEKLAAKAVIVEALEERDDD